MKKSNIFLRKTTLGIIAITLLLFSIIQSTTNVTLSINDYQVNNTSILALTPHEAIEIISDGNFTDYGFPGTGTVEDPYIIEGYNITTTESKGIHIYGTTKYFVIRNCYVDAGRYGIYIDDVADGTAIVINNTCNNDDYGIEIRYSGSAIIANNMCSNNGYGILLWSSGSATIENNTCNNNNNDGAILLEYSGSATVTNNTCNNNNYWGILLSSSSSSTIANNTCNNNGGGILIDGSGSSTVVNNTFTNCGLYIIEDIIDTYISYTVENNWVNGKELGFYTNLDSTTIAEPIYGQLILVNCTNVTVRDQIINYASIGLSLYSCTSSVIINNTCNNNYWGIRLYDSGSSTIANNTCSYNNYWAIYLSSADIATVANNTCNNNDNYGILLEDSGSSTVTNNTCSNNGYEGILLEDSGSATVSNNTCSNNGYEGIYLDYSGSSTVINNMCSNNWVGIRFYHSGSSTVVNNTCISNNNGIYISYSDLCVITYNLLQENENYGINLVSGSDNNLIHHNTFVDNYLGATSQAWDHGTNNTWYDTATQEGNYWSDWSGIGSYSIDGDANSVDLYPLGVPVVVEYSQIVLLTLLLSIVTLFLTRAISKKIKK